VFILGVLAEGDTRAAARRAAEILSVGSRCKWHPAKGKAERKEPAEGTGAGAHYYVEDCEDGTLKANGADGFPRTDRQPLVVGALTGKGNQQDDQETRQLVAPTIATGRGLDDAMPMVPACFSVTPESGQGADLRATEVEISPALGRAALELGADRGVKVLDLGVRRLTPMECERLQGFPDGWTDLGKDSPRYAALGDAVTVNVAEWIARRIAGAYDEGSPGQAA
jgi:site-specific DNA-cytosine methylase